MIDIHSHLLYGVDDGAKSYEESISMLKHARAQGIYAMILTPHYRRGMFAYPNEKIEAHFRRLQEAANEIGVRIYLGTEHHINSQVVEYIQNGRCRTLAGTHYVLAEYKPETEFSFIKTTLEELILEGYVPIVAHVERYDCMQQHPEWVEVLRRKGALIQVNANAVLGMDGRKVKQFTKRLLKNGSVDFVASDCHDLKKRSNNMGKCRDYLYKKYDTQYVDKILENNALQILQAIGR